MRSRVAVLCAALSLTLACGPATPPPTTTPPPTRASLHAEGKDKVAKALAFIEEIEAIRAQPAEPDAPPTPPPPDTAKGKKGKQDPVLPPVVKKDDTVDKGIEGHLTRAKEIKDQVVVMREELGEVLEQATDPVGGAVLQKARTILARMSEKLGDLREQRTRAMELKPKPEPKKEKAAPPAK